MSYELCKNKLAREVSRITRDELEGVLKEVLTMAGEERSNKIREARKHIKKVRALIRLLRPGIGDKCYKRENAALRKMALRMAPVRDAYARLQTIDNIIAADRSHRSPAALRRIRESLAAQLRQAIASTDESAWCKKVSAGTERALCRIKKWPLKGLTPKSVRSGLQSTYKRARRAFAVACRDPTDANLHRLRKTVKDLWYALRLLAADSPPLICVLIKRSRNLGKKLGENHDLAMVLAIRVDGMQADWQTLERVIAARRPGLQRAAFRLGKQLLTPKPGAFASLVTSHWETWRSSG